MRVMTRRIGLLSVLVVATLLAQTASAAIYLPESSYYQGETFYSNDFLRGRIDYAVYDTDLYPNEFIGDDGYEAPGEGRYIYAYQIFNNYSVSVDSVAYFSLLGMGGAPIDGIDARDDGSDGIAPSDQYIGSSEALAVWEFKDDEFGDALLLAGDHSWLLVLSSANDWVRGDYEIKPAEGGPPVPGGEPHVPEPATVTLLGIGGVLAFIRRRRFNQ
jgi:hypothetical protein